MTENPSDADVTIRGNDGTIPAGNNNGNTNGNTDGDRNGTTTPSSSERRIRSRRLTPAPSVTPGILPNPTETPEEPIITPAPAETPVQPTRPFQHGKGSDDLEGQPSDGLITGTTTKPYQDGVTPSRQPNEAEDNGGSVLINQQIGRGAGVLLRSDR